MNLDQCKKVGNVLKTHGKEGELIISSEIDLPDNFIKEESIFIKADGLLVPFFIENAFLKSSSTAVVKLEDIDTIIDAEELTSLDWHLTAEQWNRLFIGEKNNYDFLKTFLLIDQNDQEIGIITDILEIPSNTLLQVNYQDRSIDVPINKETLFYINEETKIVKIYIPEGLLDL